MPFFTSSHQFVAPPSTLLLRRQLARLGKIAKKVHALPQNGFCVLEGREGERTGRSVVNGDGRTPYVAIVGAGAAGLAAGRLLREAGIRIKILEKAPDLGGLWRYHPDPELCSPLYRSLVINVPKETMAYMDYPFSEQYLSFTTHGQVLDYLRDYAREYHLLPSLEVRCSVLSVRLAVDSPHEAGGQEPGPLSKWEVVYRKEPDCEEPPSLASTHKEVFDAVCVANGHYGSAFTPSAEGFEGFRGRSMHAKEYDRPDIEAFTGKRVLVVGAKASASDIAREVSSKASVVHVSDRKNSCVEKGGNRGNVYWRPGIAAFEGEDKVRFKDGHVEKIDTVVWATGYDYTYPFLEGTGLLSPPVTARVHPLYEQIFHTRHPSLSFIGLPQGVAVFPLSEIQASYLAAVIKGRVSLPPREERERWLQENEKEAFEERGVDPASRQAHTMNQLQWPYLKRLLRKAGGAGTLMSRSHLMKDRPRWWMNKPPAAGSEPGSSSPEHPSPKYVDGGKASPLCEADLRYAQPKPGFCGEVDEDQERRDMRLVMEMLELRQAMYDDTVDRWPAFPGSDDGYRLRMYHPDWEAGTYKVSMADFKANGEGPSKPVVPEAAGTEPTGGS